MVEEKDSEVMLDVRTTEEWLSNVQEWVPQALNKAKQVKGFPGRWKMIISKMEQIPSSLSNLSTHPCFSKNTLCKEQLLGISKTLIEAIELAEMCIQEKYEGKLRMQSNLDSLSGKLDLNLRDCDHLMKTGVLGELAMPSVSSSLLDDQFDDSTHNNIRELLARLQIGNTEAKQKALDALGDIIKEGEKILLSVVGRSNVASLVQLLTANSPRLREKTVTVICSLVESRSCESWLISENVIPPLIRLMESSSPNGKEKATVSLQRLSMSSETCRAIVGHAGVRPLIDICKNGCSVTQCASACTLKNISALPEVRQTLVEEGIVKVMISVLDCGILLESKENAAECLQNLTASNEALRRSVVSEGGIPSLLGYLDGSFPQEAAMVALRNLVGSIPIESLESLGFFPRLAHVLKSGSLEAQEAAALTICRICSSNDVKKLLAEVGCIPLLIKMLEAKTNGARESATQALSSLMTLTHNCREVKKDVKSVPNLVQLLDPNPENTAKKYAVTCLIALSSSKRCKKLMVSYGAIGYLKKLMEMDIPSAKKLLDRLEKGKLRYLFSRK